MKRPSFQFYPADWRNNTKLQRSSFAERGIWMDILCLMHDADEYGILRWTLKEIARVIGCTLQALQKMAEKGILKGGDEACEAFVYRPRHAGKEGEPVTLIAGGKGPLWFSSRMVVDEYLRLKRGASTRFTPESTPNRWQGDEPTRRQGNTTSRTPTQRQGCGATSSSSSTEVLSRASAYADVPTREAKPETEAGVRALLEKHKVNIDDAWLAAWDGYSLERMTKAIAIAKGRLQGEELRAGYLDKVLADNKNFAQNGHNDAKWFDTATGITAKGKELGIEQGAEEFFPEFKARVFAAARQAETQ